MGAVKESLASESCFLLSIMRRRVLDDDTSADEVVSSRLLWGIITTVIIVGKGKSFEASQQRTSIVARASSRAALPDILLF